MICDGCGNENALHVRIGHDKQIGRYEVCDKCGQLPNEWLPDVSMPNGRYYDEHLGTNIESKRQKADLLRKKGWVECGDRINPVLGRPTPFISDDNKRRKFFKDNFER